MEFCKRANGQVQNIHFLGPKGPLLGDRLIKSDFFFGHNCEKVILVHHGTCAYIFVNAPMLKVNWIVNMSTDAQSTNNVRLMHTSWYHVYWTMAWRKRLWNWVCMQMWSDLGSWIMICAIWIGWSHLSWLNGMTTILKKSVVFQWEIGHDKIILCKLLWLWNIFINLV